MHEGRKEHAKGGGVHHEGKGHSHHQHNAEHEGHVAHVHMHKKGGEVEEKKHHKRAKGGVIPMEGPSPIARVEERGHQKKPVTKKRGGKVEGHEAHHHLGRKARGGRMTPSSPLTGAETGNMPYMAEHKASAPLESKINQKIEGAGGDKSGAYGRGSH